MAAKSYCLVHVVSMPVWFEAGVDGVVEHLGRGWIDAGDSEGGVVAADWGDGGDHLEGDLAAAAGLGFQQAELVHVRVREEGEADDAGVGEERVGRGKLEPRNISGGVPAQTFLASRTVE